MLLFAKEFTISQNALLKCKFRDAQHASMSYFQLQNFSILFDSVEVPNTTLQLTEIGQYLVIVVGHFTNLDSFGSFESYSELFEYHLSKGTLENLLQILDGNFSGVIINTKSQEISLFNDRNGLIPLYSYEKNNTWASSTKLSSLLQNVDTDLTVDKDALECFLQLGYVVGQLTYFKEIKAIPPAVVCRINNRRNCLEITHYWSFRNINPINLKFDDSVDMLYHLVVNAVKRRVNDRENAGLSISGGLDSRLLLAIAHKENLVNDLFCYTFGSENSRDVQYAKAAVKLTGYEHRIFNFDEKNWLLQRSEGIWMTDGMLDAQHLHGSEFTQELSNHITYNLNGYLGDVVAGGGHVLRNQSFLTTQKNKIWKYYGRYAEHIDLNSDYFNPNQIEPLLYANRFRRFTNLGLLATSQSLQQKTPFFDNTVIEWALSVSPRNRKCNKAYSSMLLRYFPEFFENIPWQKTGKIVAPTSRYEFNVINKIINRLNKIFQKNMSLEFANYRNLLNTGNVNQLFELLSNTIHNHENSKVLSSLLETGVMKSPYFNDKRNILKSVTIMTYFLQLSEF